MIAGAMLRNRGPRMLHPSPLALQNPHPPQIANVAWSLAACQQSVVSPLNNQERADFTTSLSTSQAGSLYSCSRQPNLAPAVKLLIRASALWPRTRCPGPLCLPAVMAPHTAALAAATARSWALTWHHSSSGDAGDEQPLPVSKRRLHLLAACVMLCACAYVRTQA